MTGGECVEFTYEEVKGEGGFSLSQRDKLHFNRDVCKELESQLNEKQKRARATPDKPLCKNNIFDDLTSYTHKKINIYILDEVGLFPKR